MQIQSILLLVNILFFSCHSALAADATSAKPSIEAYERYSPSPFIPLTIASIKSDPCLWGHSSPYGFRDIECGADGGTCSVLVTPRTQLFHKKSPSPSAAAASSPVFTPCVLRGGPYFPAVLVRELALKLASEELVPNDEYFPLLSAFCEKQKLSLSKFIVKLSEGLSFAHSSHKPFVSAAVKAEHALCNAPLMWCNSCKKQTDYDRIFFVLIMLEQVLGKFSQAQPLHLISFGSGGCLQLFLEAYGLVLLGYTSLTIVAIDPATFELYKDDYDLAAVLNCRISALVEGFESSLKTEVYPDVERFFAAESFASIRFPIAEFVDADMKRPTGGAALPPGEVYTGEDDFELLVDRLMTLGTSEDRLVLSMIDFACSGIKMWDSRYSPAISPQKKLVEALLERA